MKIPKFVSNVLIKRGFNKLVRTIRQQYTRKWDAESTIEFLFSKEAALIRPWQFREEITALAKEIEALKPKVAVEIGTANGGTLFMTCKLSAPDALIISIDLPGGAYGGGYPEWKTPIYSSFAQPNQKLHLLRGDSHEIQMLNNLKKLLNGRKIDYLFIDGDHSYAGVKQDFQMYSPFVDDNGKIAFHDIVKHKDDSCDVFKLWHELKNNFQSKEFVNDWEQKMFGIGVLYQNKKAQITE